MMLNIVLILISLVDLSGAFLHVWPIPGNFMLAIALILMGKGIWSIISSISAGFYWDILGMIDFLAGIILVIVNFGTPLSFGWIIGVVLALKAGYTIVSSLR